MATIFKLDWAKIPRKTALCNYAESVIDRWGWRQEGAAFVAVTRDIIVTDYVHDHKELQLLRHLMNCQGIPFEEVTNVDLNGIFSIFKTQKMNNQKRSQNNAH